MRYMHLKHRMFLVTAALFLMASLALVSGFLVSPVVGDQVDVCWEYGQCYYMGLVNCEYLTGCPGAIGFRCVQDGDECSYYDLWCPDCNQQ